MSNIDIFLNEYKELEDWAKDNGFNEVKDLEEEYPNKKDLGYFRHARNLLTHNAPNDHYGNEYITLNDNFIVRFRRLFDGLTKPRLAIECGVKRSDIYSRQMGDKILPAVKYMKEKNYTYTPVMLNNTVWGVFSENTLFDIYSNDEAMNVDSSFLQISNFITVKDKNAVYGFISKYKTIEDVRKIFNAANNEDKRLDVLFITETGNYKEPLLGMITIWDMATID